jgi:hypothetical protein
MQIPQMDGSSLATRKPVDVFGRVWVLREEVPRVHAGLRVLVVRIQ